jgi:hypothetical protein
MYDGKYHPWNPPVLGVGTSARVRPWEGGLDTEAVLEYLTGFSPDAGNQRVVFAPHLPENRQAFGARNFCVGPAQVSLALKRLGPRQWTATLHLDKGEQLDVTMDFWASRRVLADIGTDGPVTWDKTLSGTSGREGRCEFTLQAADYSFTVTEDALLPDEELEPPKPAVFQPDPYEVPGGDLLLLTSPTAVLNRHDHNYKFVKPKSFLKAGRGEWETVENVTRSVEFLDLDLPVSPGDIARGLLDGKGNPKFKLAVFGREAFSPGKQHFKPADFWTDPALAAAMSSFVEKGGCLYLGPSYAGRESVPEWMTTLTQGGWDEGDVKDDAIVTGPANTEPAQKLLDELPVADPAAEGNHSVTWSGLTSTDSRELPELNNERKTIRDKGRGFTGYYQFTAKTEPGSVHRVWARVDTGRSLRGLALMVWSGGGWKQVGAKTRDTEPQGRFQSLYFDVPLDRVKENQTSFRLVSKEGLEVGIFRVWVYAMGKNLNLSLGEMLGFSSRDSLGQVNHGLIPKGSGWKAPVVLSQHPDQAALMIQKIGKGYLIRSEISLEKAVPTLKALLKANTLENLGSAFPDS